MINKGRLLNCMRMLKEDANDEGENKVSQCLDALIITISAGLFDKKEEEKKEHKCKFFCPKCQKNILFVNGHIPIMECDECEEDLSVCCTCDNGVFRPVSTPDYTMKEVKCTCDCHQITDTERLDFLEKEELSVRYAAELYKNPYNVYGKYEIFPKARFMIDAFGDTLREAIDSAIRNKNEK